MTAADSGKFTNWLNEKLRELNTDETVFGSYIIGILQGDDTLEDKKEALNDILSEIIDNHIEDLIAAILNKWLENHPQEDEPPKKGLAGLDVNEQLAKLLEVQKLQTTVKERQYTAEERRIKEQILAQYSQTAVSDGEDAESGEDEKHDKGPAANAKSGIERNTNAQDVMQLQKERREQARVDSAAKKQKDKEDREKQKQLREEKKEKRKTVKGERRR